MRFTSNSKHNVIVPLISVIASSEKVIMIGSLQEIQIECVTVVGESPSPYSVEYIVKLDANVCRIATTSNAPKQIDCSLTFGSAWHIIDFPQIDLLNYAGFLKSCKDPLNQTRRPMKLTCSAKPQLYSTGLHFHLYPHQ